MANLEGNNNTQTSKSNIIVSIGKKHSLQSQTTISFSFSPFGGVSKLYVRANFSTHRTPETELLNPAFPPRFAHWRYHQDFGKKAHNYNVCLYSTTMARFRS